MPTTYEDKIKEQARSYLEPGERVLAAFIAQPRGATIAKVGGLAPGAVGGREGEAGEARRRGRRVEAGGPDGARADRSPVGRVENKPADRDGQGGDVKQLFSAVPPGDVDSIEVKRLLVERS